MLQNLMKKRREGQGFTIIEVLIVLAIAGLIIAVVLIAIPQLQRNQRNEARRSITNRIKTELDSYAGNNNGTYPTATTGTGASELGTATTGFIGRYLSGISANIQEPKTGSPMYPNPAAGTAQGYVRYRVNTICAGESSTGTGASARNYTLVTNLEGGATYCVDNR